MKFSVLSWNVKHFKLKSKDVKGIISHIKRFDPDVIGIYEIKGKDVHKHLEKNFPHYGFHITEGKHSQKILVGVRGSLTSMITQRTEFKTGNDFLRPGLLLKLTKDNENYSLLFLHTKSFPLPIGLGTRDSQFSHAFRLKRTLDKDAKNKKSKFIILGDLNTMGMRYPFDRNIVSKIELKKLERDAKKVDMKLLNKTYENTWTNGKKVGNLDHVVASTSIKFTKWSNSEVRISGWNNLEGLSRQHFIKKKIIIHSILRY